MRSPAHSLTNGDLQTRHGLVLGSVWRAASGFLLSSTIDTLAKEPGGFQKRLGVWHAGASEKRACPTTREPRRQVARRQRQLRVPHQVPTSHRQPTRARPSLATHLALCSTFACSRSQHLCAEASRDACRSTDPARACFARREFDSDCDRPFVVSPIEIGKAIRKLSQCCALRQNERKRAIFEQSCHAALPQTVFADSMHSAFSG